MLDVDSLEEPLLKHYLFTARQQARCLYDTILLILTITRFGLSYNIIALKSNPLPICDANSLPPAMKSNFAGSSPSSCVLSLVQEDIGLSFYET